MKRARVGIMAAAVFAVASVAFAQAKPDFSGTWTLDPEASNVGGGGGGRGMMMGPITIKVAGDVLTIERMQGEAKVVTTLNLAGQPTENQMAGRQGATTTGKYVSKWDGPKLVTTITSEGPNGPQTRTESRWLEGATLVVETTRTGRDGNPMTTKVVYKKTT
jgi:hypothetical protein